MFGIDLGSLKNVDSGKNKIWKNNVLHWYVGNTHLCTFGDGYSHVKGTHWHVNLGSDTCLCGMGHMVVYLIVGCVPVYVYLQTHIHPYV